MPDKEQEKVKADYQKLVDRANGALVKEGVDVGAQLVLVLGDGQQIAVKAITAQPVVVEQKKEDGRQPKVEDSGKSPNNEPVPEQAKQS